MSDTSTKPTLSIVLDTRERKLQDACKELVIPYKTQTLSLGDIQVINETDQTVQMMIERKSWQDLASSILDNRYREQHSRYMKWSLDNKCEVWYILEGNRKFRSPSQEKRTLSAYLSLCFDKNVRVVETKNPLGTMEWLHKVLQKIQVRGLDWLSCGICMKQSGGGGGGGGADVDKEATELAQQKICKLGKKQHSKLSTWIAMLSCIYGMSVVKATAIMGDWDNPDSFVQWLRETSETDAVKHLSSIKLPAQTNGKMRKLGNVLAKRVVSMFYYIKE